MMNIPTNERLSARQLPRSCKSRNTVVLFGEILADIFPDSTVLGGAPFNVARHLKAFGQNPVLISRLGNDELRDEVLSVMSQHGMETLGIQCNQSHPTGRVQVHMEDGTHRFEILSEQAYDYIHPAVARMSTLSANPARVYYGTLAQRHDTSRRALSSLFRSTDAAKFLDINLRSPWYEKRTLRQSLEFANIVKLNADELDVLTTMFEIPEQNPQARVQEFMDRFDLQQVMVTCGEEGAWQMNREGKKVESCATQSVSKMVDTVGAGDAFASVYILGSLLGWPMAMMLERANNFATAICEIRGAAPDQESFYEPYLVKWGI